MSDEIIVNREDWSLQRKGYLDQSRHKEKVQEAVKQQLGDLIVDESIILSDGKKAIKIPMRSLEEFRFRYDYNKKKNTGQSTEKVSPGDILGREATKGKGNGNESGAGEEPGIDIYEAEITYDDLAEILFEELRLPNLDDKKRPKISHDRPEFNDVRKTGLMANVDKKRTLLESIKRQARESHGLGSGRGSEGDDPRESGSSLQGLGAEPRGAGSNSQESGSSLQELGGEPRGSASNLQGSESDPAVVPVEPKRNLRITPEDLRFKTWETRPNFETNAVILAMMDTSGSMGQFEKYISRTFFFWMVRFLRTKYKNVEMRFLAHHTEAKEVSEEEFFTRGESGGTRCSSVYKLALDLIEADYPPAHYNIYPVHFTDGDNIGSDNARALSLMQQLVDASRIVGYGEILRTHYSSTLMATLKRITDPKLRLVTIRDRNEVYTALKTVFS
ncbi:hypothetical protein CEB3_c14370 [Peptococcaceae bacterium CEB3]|nr:hypothetical protein CEB3_c14370 [Peptococcaceae bacterium CEB3]